MINEMIKRFVIVVFGLLGIFFLCSITNKNCSVNLYANYIIGLLGATWLTSFLLVANKLSTEPIDTWIQIGKSIFFISIGLLLTYYGILIDIKLFGEMGNVLGSIVARVFVFTIIIMIFREGSILWDILSAIHARR